MNNQAYEIGYKAAKENGNCIPAFNSELMDLIKGMEVGGGSYEAMKSFQEGVNKGLEL